MTNACLSSGRSEFKTCPSCKGDGYEDSPPMRRCGICKGKGRLPAQADSGPTKGVGADQSKAHSSFAGLSDSDCDQVQGAL